MERDRLVPDVHTYGVFIHGLCMISNMKEASKLFRSMRERHLEPNDVIYNTMFLAYCKEGSSYWALRLLEEMVRSGLVPGYLQMDHWSSLQGWQVDEAEALLKAMIGSGLNHQFQSTM